MSSKDKLLKCLGIIIVVYIIYKLLTKKSAPQGLAFIPVPNDQATITGIENNSTEGFQITDPTVQFQSNKSDLKTKPNFVNTMIGIEPNRPFNIILALTPSVMIVPKGGKIYYETPYQTYNFGTAAEAIRQGASSLHYQFIVNRKGELKPALNYIPDEEYKSDYGIYPPSNIYIDKYGSLYSDMQTLQTSNPDFCPLYREGDTFTVCERTNISKQWSNWDACGCTNTKDYINYKYTDSRDLGSASTRIRLLNTAPSILPSSFTTTQKNNAINGLYYFLQASPDKDDNPRFSTNDFKYIGVNSSSNGNTLTWGKGFATPFYINYVKEVPYLKTNVFNKNCLSNNMVNGTVPFMITNPDCNLLNPDNTLSLSNDIRKYNQNPGLLLPDSLYNFFNVAVNDKGDFDDLYQQCGAIDYALSSSNFSVGDALTSPKSQIYNYINDCNLMKQIFRGKDFGDRFTYDDLWSLTNKYPELYNKYKTRIDNQITRLKEAQSAYELEQQSQPDTISFL
jgi:hypothetical protein